MSYTPATTTLIRVTQIIIFSLLAFFESIGVILYMFFRDNIAWTPELTSTGAFVLGVHALIGIVVCILSASAITTPSRGQYFKKLFRIILVVTFFTICLLFVNRDASCSSLFDCLPQYDYILVFLQTIAYVVYTYLNNQCDNNSTRIPGQDLESATIKKKSSSSESKKTLRDDYNVY